MKFNSFNKANLSVFRKELEEVLSKYGIEANLEIEVGNMRFSESDVEVKINAKIIGAVTFADVMLDSVIRENGLVKEKNGRKLVRYDSKKWKMPFIYQDRDGKLYKTNVERAKLLFGA